jgi:thiamine pyrophosphate-dependent acetolactate synthase large subunit-like protein
VLFQEAMADALVDQGITAMFGLIGDGNLFIVDAFRRRPDTTYLGVVNEASAVEAACGYSQATDLLVAATVTHGPALTNTVTALVEAVKARRPLLLIAGDTDAAVRDHLQDVPQRAVVLATGAGFEQVRTPLTMAEDLARAVRRALLERRPVVVNVPVEFQWQHLDYAPHPSDVEPVQDVLPAPAALDRAGGIIASAERPIVLAGRGAVTPQARASLLRFAQRLGAPVATTLKARDLFGGEPHDLGVFGTLSLGPTLDAITASDCLISFGAGLNRFTTAEGSLVAKRRLVQVDIDREAFGRYEVPDAAVVGDAATVAEAFVALLDEAEVRPHGFASPELAAELARARRAVPPERDGAGFIDVHTALHRIEQAVPAARSVVTDVGRFIGATWTHLHVPDPTSFVHTTNYGAIGLGLGTALGVAIGKPGQPVLLVTGDGGFMLGGLNEFSTAVRNRLDLIVVVLNDKAYGAEHIQFVNRGLDPELSMFDWPDFGPVATALGGLGFTVRSVAELDAALRRLPERDRPVLIDVHLDPEKVRLGGH